jgi:FkbM family methyltransferase
MGLRAFLYRRLSRWVTCEFGLPGRHKLSLRSKYEVASLADVFLHPFYWQLFHWVARPPRLVVDGGAHCGHFSILADLCFASKFGGAEARYVLVEPNPYLLPRCRANLRDAGLAARARVVQGLLGMEGAHSTLWIHPRNYLASGCAPAAGARPCTVPCLRLRDLAGEGPIDVLKLDIEGAEYALVRQEPEVFARARLVCLELHASAPGRAEELLADLRAAGLESVMPPVASAGHQLALLKGQAE